MNQSRITTSTRTSLSGAVTRAAVVLGGVSAVLFATACSPSGSATADGFAPAAGNTLTVW